MRCTSMSSVYACTQLKKHREGNRDLWSHPPVFLRDAPVVLLPPLVVITGGIGLFPHGSHKQRTHCLVSVFSQSWECFVKNDSVRSCLIELQSFLQSKIDVDPIYRVLMFLPCFVHVLCKTRCFQVDLLRISVFLIQRIHRQKEYCLSVAQNLTSMYQSRIEDGM